MTAQNNRFLQLHLLTSYGPANLNRETLRGNPQALAVAEHRGLGSALIVAAAFPTDVGNAR